MKVRMVLQHNRGTGQRVLVFTQDREAPVEDFIVSLPGASEVFDTEVAIIAQDERIEELLLDLELRGGDASDTVLVDADVLQGVLNGRADR